MDTLNNTVGEALQDVGDTIKAVAVVVGDKIEEALERDNASDAVSEKDASNAFTDTKEEE